MYTRDQLPTIGAAFWSVGSGDSTTLLLGEHDGHDVVVQVDLHHCVKAEDDEDPTVPMVDQLVEVLPEVGGKPHLAVFALTHPDEDHIRGFAQLLDEVTIGELWFTPKVFDEYDNPLCDDAQAFKDEADRRVALYKNGTPGDGDRVRVIGRSELFDDAPFKYLPDSARSSAGKEFTTINAADLTGRVRVFVHAPFSEDAAGERNETSLALHITLTDDDASTRLLLVGDLSHVTLAKIIERTSDTSNLDWDVLLAPHHCSKKALFDSDGALVTEVYEGLKDRAQTDAWVVASSSAIPTSDSNGADPPHRKAWNKYGDMVGTNQRICTATHGDIDSPDPVVFDTAGYVKPEPEPKRGLAAAAATAAALGVAVAAARPRPTPPTVKTGYGAQ